MKSFFVKVLAFIAIIICLNQIILSNVPYWWGSPVLNYKMPFLKKNNSKYNVVFLGSSRLYRHIIPARFDSYVKKKSNLKIKSFNLSAGGASNPETFYLLEKIIKDNDINPEYLIAEFVPNPIIGKRNLHTTRVIYNMNFNALVNAVKIANSSKFLEQKENLRYVISFLERAFLIPVFDDLLTFAFNKSEPPKNKYVSRAGYVPLENSKRREEYLKNKKELQLRKNSIKQNYEQIDSSKYLYNTAYLAYANRLIRKAEKKNIKLIFVLAPRNADKDAFFTFNLLDPEHRININSVSEYPKFYKDKYTYDIGHLNDKGARLMSTKLAEKFLELCLY